MEQVAKSVKDQLAAHVLDTRRDVGVMTDDQIDACLPDGLVTKFLDGGV